MYLQMNTLNMNTQLAQMANYTLNMYTQLAQMAHMHVSANEYT